MKEKSEKPLLLIFPFDLLSHYLRCLELAKILKKSFRILFAHSDTYYPFILDEGFETFPCLSINSEEIMDCAKLFDFSWINENNLEPVFLAQTERIAALNPVAVLGDTSPTLKMAAEKAGVKYISLMNAYMSKHYALGRKLSKTHPAFKYSKKLPDGVFKFITELAERIVFYIVHRPFKKLRQKYGLSGQSYYLDELEGDVNFLCDLEEMFPQKSLPSHYSFISPLFFNPKSKKEDIRERIDETKKTIFVTMGSTGEWEKMSFVNSPFFEKFNVITAGDKKKILNSSHIISFPFINIHDAFPFTDLVICHGGNGTIYQALSYGIPVLCKTAHFEQEWNVHGLERLGLGQSLDEMEKTQDYIDTIENWIKKKDDNQMSLYKEKIQEQLLNLESALDGSWTSEVWNIKV